MASFWVTFRNKNEKPCCVDANNAEDALIIAQQARKVFVDQVLCLPYPATPRINTKPGSVPAFCFAPEQCAGHSSCPKRIACSE